MTLETHINHLRFFLTFLVEIYNVFRDLPKYAVIDEVHRVHTRCKKTALDRDKKRNAPFSIFPVGKRENREEHENGQN